MKFDIRNRFTGEVQFTAEIECDEAAPTSIKLGLAVKWAIGSGAYLGGASLGGADLSGASLGGADLSAADLSGADLSGADLGGADLGGAYLGGANLSGADLSGADLGDLGGAYLGGAKISDLATLGFPNGWGAYTYVTEAGEQRVQVGCRNKTLAEGRAYWADKAARREVLAALDYAEAIGRARRWGPAATKQAAE
jgi:hypothetical protein